MTSCAWVSAARRAEGEAAAMDEVESGEKASIGEVGVRGGSGGAAAGAEGAVKEEEAEEVAPKDDDAEKEVRGIAEGERCDDCFG
jgi:hypothetical protein